MLARSPFTELAKCLFHVHRVHPAPRRSTGQRPSCLQKIATLDVVNQRSDRDANDSILHACRFSVCPARHPTFGIPVLVPDQVRQIRELVSRLDDDSSPTTAIAAVWTAARNVSSAENLRHPLPPSPPRQSSLDLIQKHPRISIIPDFPARRSTGAANIGPLEALRSGSETLCNPAFELRSLTDVWAGLHDVDSRWRHPTGNLLRID